jgi:hypothetical protein
VEDFDRETQPTKNVSEMKLKRQIVMMGWMEMEPRIES